MARFWSMQAAICLAGCIMQLGAKGAAATPLYGISFGTTQQAVFYDVNAQTGAASNPRFVGAGHVVGIAYVPEGVIYGLTNSSALATPNSLIRIDPVTGASEVVGGTGLPSIVEGDLARDPISGRLYGCYNLQSGMRQLFTVDPQTGAAAPITGSLYGDPSALAFSNDGTLYGIDASLGELFVIDKNTGAILSNTALNVALGSTAGMAVDPATGVFYVADGESGGTDTLYTLDPSSGVLTAVGPLGVADGLAGLTFVPEPGAAMLMGLAASVVATRRPFRRRVR